MCPRPHADDGVIHYVILQGVQHWKKFYAESKKYTKVGRVSHPPIDPASPYPEHCDPKKAQARAEEHGDAKEAKREEL